jgi:hypothetical protein
MHENTYSIAYFCVNKQLGCTFEQFSINVLCTKSPQYNHELHTNPSLKKVIAKEPKLQ